MSGKLRKTYKSEIGLPHIPTDEYVEKCNQQYKELIRREPPENEIQQFLERHPSLVPGHLTPIGTSGHLPLHCALITQPELPGLKSYRPDFMWIATHSGAWFPTLIEIEKPGKKIFTKAGRPTSQFTEARNQLAQWRSWFNNPTNARHFTDSYGIPDYMQRRAMHLHMILIYGRRAEFEEDPTLTKLRDSQLNGHDEELISFDRLHADASMADAITIRAISPRKYRAVWVPPTFATGPDLAERFLHVEGIAEAIDQNPEISKERKQFLKRRIPYWKDWAPTSGGTIIGPNDRE